MSTPTGRILGRAVLGLMLALPGFLLAPGAGELQVLGVTPGGDDVPPGLEWPLARGGLCATLGSAANPATRLGPV
jgi:hypothetical protein